MAANTIVRDNFVRAGSAGLGANWTEEVGTVSVTEIGIQSSGVAAPDDNTGNATSWYNAKPFAASQYAEVLTSASSKNEGVCLLAVPGDTWYRCISTTAGCAIQRCAAGSLTQVASDSLGGVASGSLIRAEAVTSGSSLILNMYVNGTLRLTYTDTSPFTTGAPGLAAYQTTALMGAWEGGNLIWTRRGTVIPTVAGGGTEEPSVIYEGNAKLLSGNVFKMWYSNGWDSPVTVVNYAESTDGITWVTNTNPPTAVDIFAGSALSANWTVEIGAFAVSSNAVSTNSNSTQSTAWWNASSFTDDQYAQVRVASLGPDGGGPAVRCSATGCYVAYFNTTAITLLTWDGTAWGGSTLATYAAPTVGQVVGISAVGSTITVYVNGVSVGSVTDTGHTSGHAGLAGYDIVGYTSTYGNWSAGNGAIGPSYNPVMANGATPVVHGSVFHFGSTYYAYYSNGSPATQLDQWTSSDGVNWTLAHAAVLSAGTTGAWDVGGPYNPWVWIEGSTWYMLYEGNNAAGVYSLGLATSSDGISWTKYTAGSGNPVLSNGSGSVSSPTLYKIGNTYYMWNHTSPTSNLPSDISLWSSTDLHTWTPSSKNPIYERVLADEGVNVSGGQVADTIPLEVSGTVYMYYSATAVQSAGYMHINLATVPYTMAQLVASEMEVSIISGNAGVAGATVSYTGTASGSVTADGSGNYTLNLANGTYTITPTKTSYTFSPSSTGETVASTSVTGVNFTASGSSQLATPTFAMSDGALNLTQQVTITVDVDATSTYYTTDGSTPTPASTLYSGPFNITTGETITAYSVASGYTDSAAGAVTYAQQATPTFSPVAGSYGPTQSVSITSASATEVYYEVGSSPYPSHETLYTTQVSVASSETVYARAARTGYVNSAVSSAAYTINGAQATPTFSPVAGSYGPTQSVTITSTGADAIYYTTDGTSPTTGSTLYTGAVSVATSETLKALAVKAGWSNSSIGSAVYTINGAVATPTFSPVAGTYSSAQSVTVSDANSGLPGFAMYYTTNGNSPTTGSTLYTGAITVSASETIKVLAVATGYSNSTVGSAAYVISLPTYTVSGNAGVAGATIYYTGTSSGSTTADSSGNYSITVTNGTYTLTPTLSAYTFSPTNASETVSSANITGVNFTATFAPTVFTANGLQVINSLLVTNSLQVNNNLIPAPYTQPINPGDE